MEEPRKDTKTNKDPRREFWLEELKKMNPDIEPYFLDFMIECYLLNPKKTEEIINSHHMTQNNMLG